LFYKVINLELLINYLYILQITVSQRITKDGYCTYNIIYIYRIANKYHISIDLRYYSCIISLYVINLKIKYRANYIRHRNPIEYTNEEENSFPYCFNYFIYILSTHRYYCILLHSLSSMFSVTILCIFYLPLSATFFQSSSSNLSFAS